MEVEVPPANRVDQIREELVSLRGRHLRVRANMGRSRVVERTGTLVGAYPTLFVVEVDVLTGAVEIYDHDTGERLFDFGFEGQQL